MYVWSCGHVVQPERESHHTYPLCYQVRHRATMLRTTNHYNYHSSIIIYRHACCRATRILGGKRRPRPSIIRPVIYVATRHHALPLFDIQGGTVPCVRACTAPAGIVVVAFGSIPSSHTILSFSMITPRGDVTRLTYTQNR